MNLGFQIETFPDWEYLVISDLWKKKCADLRIKTGSLTGIPELHTGVQFSFSLKLKSLLRKYRKQIFGLWILILNIFDSK